MNRKSRWYGSNVVEKSILFLITTSAVLMFFYQGFICQSPFWQIVNPVGSEVQAVSKPTEPADDTVILQLMNFSTLPKAKVLNNGKVVGDFTESYITVPVSDGDMLEVDTSYYQHPVTIRVLDSTKRVVSPGKGLEFTGERTVFTIGKVKLSNN